MATTIYWKGGNVGSGSQEADPDNIDNWVTSSGGTTVITSTIHNNMANNDVIIDYETSGNQPIQFTASTSRLTYKSIDVRYHSNSNYAAKLQYDGTVTLILSGLKIAKSQMFKPEGAGTDVLTIKFTGVPKYTSFGSPDPDLYFITDSANDVNLDRDMSKTNFGSTDGVFYEGTRSSITFLFEPPDGTILTLQNGLYPKMDFDCAGSDTATLRPATVNNNSDDSSSNNCKAVFMSGLDVDSSFSVKASGAKYRDKGSHWIIEGSLTLLCSELDMGYTIFELISTQSELKFPVTGTTHYGVDNNFTSKFSKVIIGSPEQSNYQVICEDNTILTCEELIIRGGARFYGPVYGSDSSAEIHTIKKPVVEGDWNFGQVADGVYRTVGTPARLNVTSGGTGLNSIPSKSLMYGDNKGAIKTITFPSSSPAGKVLAIDTNGTGFEWSATAGGGGLDAIDVENTDSGYTWGTSDVSSISTLKLVAGANVTLASDTSAKAIRITSTDTNTTYSAASTSAAGLVTALPNPHGGKFLRGDNTWVIPPDTDTTYTAFAGSTSPGTAALVPARDSGSTTTKYLREDGDWVVPPDTDTVYTHPTSAGNKHIPAGGASGNFLKYSSDGTAVWATPSYTTDTNTTTTADVLTALNADWGASKTFGTQLNDTVTFSGPVTSLEGTYTGVHLGPAASAHNATGAQLLIKGGDTTAGTTDNIAGGKIILEAGRGKGSGAGGNIVFRVANEGSSGNSLNAAATAMTIFDDSNIEMAADLTVGGNFTVNGTTTTLNVTNMLVDDNLMELNSGASSNANDSGLIIERGSTGDNALFIWDESEDKFAVGTTTATADATGNITYTTASLIANLVGNVTGDVTGDVTGNVSGTAATVTGAAQTNITSLGTLTALTGGTGDLVWDTNTLFVDSSTDRVGIGTSSPGAPLHVSKTLTGNDATTLVGAEVLRIDSIDDGSSSNGPGFQIRLEATNDHNGANYEKVIMGDGGGQRVKNKHGNWGFSEWWLAGNADGHKPIMSLVAGGSTGAGAAQDGILTLYSTTSAWATNTWSPSNNTAKVVLDAGGNSYFTGGNLSLGSTTNHPALLNLVKSGDDQPMINFVEQDQADVEFGIYNHFAGGGETGNGIYVGTGISSWAGNDAPIMFYRGDGNVFMGADSIKGMSLADTIQLNINTPTTRKRSILQLSSGSSTDADVIGSLWCSNSDNADGSNFDADSKMIASIEAYVETSDSNASDDSGGHLAFITKPEAGTIAERMRITSAGDVGIGALAAGGTKLVVEETTNPQLRLQNPTNAANGWDFRVGDTGSLIFKDDGTERVRFASDGNVGIGTTSPASLLHVGSTAYELSSGAYLTNSHQRTAKMVIHADDANTDWDEQEIGLALHNEDPTANNWSPHIAFTTHEDDDGDPANANPVAVAAISATYNTRVANGWAKGDLVFFTNNAGTGNAERLRITSAGKVGIGSTSPSGRLHVETTNTYQNGISDATAYFKAINTQSSDGYPVTLVLDSDHTGGGTGNDEVRTRYLNAGIQKWQHNVGADMKWYYDSSGDNSGSWSEKMRFTSTGRLGIGTTSPDVPLDVVTGSSGKLLQLNDANTAGTYMGIAGDRAQVGYSSNGLTLQGGATKGINFAVNNGTHGSGIVATFDTSGTFNVVGAITAATKEFVIDHPTKPNMKLHHGSLEGPEHAVYVRGKGNSATIHLPDYWTGLVDEDTITVQLTAIGHPQELYVRGIKSNKVRVAAKSRNRMLNYFYFIQAERKDIKKLEVEESLE